MSKLSDKYAAGRRALADRQGTESGDPGLPNASIAIRAAGPLHGSVSTMKMDMMRSELVTLRSAKPVMKLQPGEIRASIWANRHPDSFESAEFAAFKLEISSAKGNIQAIKVRALNADEAAGKFKYEIVYGHRRHRACLELGIEVNAIVEELDEKGLFIQMDRENRAHAKLRPYEQGLMYARALDAGLFSSLRKLAEDVDADATNVSKAIALARLPAPVLESFVSPLDIQYRWGSDLRGALDKEPDLILARAADIKKMRVSGKSVSSQEALAILVGKAPALTKSAPRTVLVGSKVLMITEKNKKVAFQLDALSRDKQAKIEKFITDVMAE